MSILSLLAADNFITVNKAVIGIVGLEAAVVFGELASESLYWSKQNPDFDGFFYSTIENIESKTYLSAYKQATALARLQAEGWIEVISKKGIPPKRYIRINEEKVAEALDFQKSKNFTFVDENSSLSKPKNFERNKNINKKNIEKEKDSIKALITKSGFTEDLQTAISDFNDMRKKLRKPMTERALSMLIKKAMELADNNEEVMIQIFNQSTQNSWLGVYPLKTAYSGKGTQNEFLDLLKDIKEEGNDEKGSASNSGVIPVSISDNEN